MREKSRRAVAAARGAPSGFPSQSGELVEGDELSFEEWAETRPRPESYGPLNAKSCEPGGPQDLDSASLSAPGGAVKPFAVGSVRK
jgi:hypothetical protein